MTHSEAIRQADERRHWRPLLFAILDFGVSAALAEAHESKACDVRKYHPVLIWNIRAMKKNKSLLEESKHKKKYLSFFIAHRRSRPMIILVDFAPLVVANHLRRYSVFSSTQQILGNCLITGRPTSSFKFVILLLRHVSALDVSGRRCGEEGINQVSNSYEEIWYDSTCFNSVVVRWCQDFLTKFRRRLDAPYKK